MNPSTFLPGTWTRLAQGTFLTSAGSSYSPRGAYGSNTHKLTANEMPAHTHNANWPRWTGTNGSSGNGFAYTGDWTTEPTSSAGGGAAHNNMPLSMAVYIWVRTA